jgi:hypothetical protein
MSEAQKTHLVRSLPAELELALRSATWRTLIALQALRSAVREHVRYECGDGTSRNDIDDGLRIMISSCGPGLHHIDYSAERTGEVTMQVLKWSAEFYRPPR